MQPQQITTSFGSPQTLRNQTQRQGSATNVFNRTEFSISKNFAQAPRDQAMDMSFHSRATTMQQ